MSRCELAIRAADGPGEVAAVLRALAASPYWQLQRVLCELQDGELVLRGTVASYYLKQLAQEAAIKAARGCVLRNEVQVLNSDSTPSQRYFD